MAVGLRETRWTGEDGRQCVAYDDDTIGASVPSMLLARARATPDATILRKKDRGIWKEQNWSQLAAHARRVGMGLKALGFAPGDVAALLADTSPEWVYADLGILGAGGISAGLDPSSEPAAAARLLTDCGARIVFVEGDEQLDKALDAKAHCPALLRIVIFDMTGLRDLDDPLCEGLDVFLARGDVYDQAHPGDWEAGVAGISGTDIAALVYTSNTRGVMLSHRNVLYHAVNGTKLAGQRVADERLAFLPMSYPAERIVGLYYALYSGTVSNYVEGPGTVGENLREAQPTVMTATPAFWERLHSRIMTEVQEATWLQRQAYGWAIGIGLRAADARLAGRSSGGLLYALASRFVLGSLRREIGLDRVRFAYVVSARLAPDLVRWYLALGVTMLEVYGQAECGGVATVMPAGDIRLGTAGVCVPYGEMRLSSQGEILLRGDQVSSSYWNAPNRSVVRDGWLHTGDTGEIKDGYLSVTGRMPVLQATTIGKQSIASTL